LSGVRRPRPESGAHRGQSWRAYAAGSGLSLALCGAALGDTLSSESSVGLSSGYNSNPFLQPSGAQAAESLAVLANLPATYTSDTQSLELEPRLRFAETHGALALLPDYQYLDGVWRVNSERNTFTASADWHHDSTFYNEFENAVLLGRDLRRQEDIANLDWRRELTERSDLHLSGSWDKVNYSESVVTGLQSFSYGQALVQFDHTLNERWKWTNTVGVGRYELIGQRYRSDDRFVQTALTRALSERWSLTAQVGYSYLSTSAQGYICCKILLGPNGYFLQAIPVTQNESRGSASFALTIERRMERLVMNLAISRAIQPSGLGALLTQDDVSLKASIPWTYRLTLAATLHGSRISDPLQPLAVNGQRYANVDLSANWLWTEHWTLQLQGTYLVERVISLGPNASSTSVYLNLLRQFGRIRL
jgi:hypothetical protein